MERLELQMPHRMAPCPTLCRPYLCIRPAAAFLPVLLKGQVPCISVQQALYRRAAIQLGPC